MSPRSGLYVTTLYDYMTMATLITWAGHQITTDKINPKTLNNNFFFYYYTKKRIERLNVRKF